MTGREKVPAVCGDCGHKWAALKRSVEWAREYKYALTCRACDMRRSAARHFAAARHLVDQANAIDARRAARGSDNRQSVNSGEKP